VPERQLMQNLKPVLSDLNKKMDRRLGKTALGLVMTIIQNHHRNNGSLLSELGGYLLGEESVHDCSIGIPLSSFYQLPVWFMSSYSLS
jgi:hypothetical protein